MREFVGIDLTKGFYDYPITSMIGLTTVNVEISSKCNKSCWMCGRRRLEKEHIELCDWGDMNLDLMYKVLKQIPTDIIVQFHDNGEPLLYPYLYQALNFRDDYIRCFDTNAKLLLEKADYIIDNMESLTISVIENDLEQDEQYEIVKKFLEIKRDKPPFMIYRLLGDIKIVPGSDNVIINIEREQRWYKLPGIVATRTLHSPYGSYDYEKKVTIPEIGICLDLLHHLLIDREGWVYPCVRYNPYKYNCLGNIKVLSLQELWHSKLRKNLIKEHIKGNRNCSELCSKCHYYGCPIS